MSRCAASFRATSFPRTPSLTAARWTSRVFGADIAGSFEAPGLDAGGAPARGAPVEIKIADSEPGGWERSGASIASVGTGPTLLEVFRPGPNRFAFVHASYGRYLVQAGGPVVCLPGELSPPWRWQRFLIGQVLPLLPVLAGLEVQHTSGVVRGNASYLFAGASGAGKTTAALSVALLDSRAELLTDDVAAIEATPDGVVAHPGAAITSVDASSEDWVISIESGLGGRRLGMEEGEERIQLPVTPHARPVAAVFMLEAASEGGAVEIAEVHSGGAVALLGSTFNPYVSDPGRLSGQLGLLSALFEQAPLLRVTAPRGLGPRAAAEAVLAEMDRRGGG